MVSEAQRCGLQGSKRGLGMPRRGVGGQGLGPLGLAKETEHRRERGAVAGRRLGEGRGAERGRWPGPKQGRYT